MNSSTMARSGRAGSPGGSRSSVAGAARVPEMPKPRPLDVLFGSGDVVRSLAIPPNIAVKVAEAAGQLYAATAPPKPGAKGGAAASSQSMANRNKAYAARSSLQEALEQIDRETVAGMHHANVVASTLANAALTSTQHTLSQYVGLYQGAHEEVAKLSHEMDERDRDAVRVVDFLRRELELKHQQHQRLVVEHRAELAQQQAASDAQVESLRAQLRAKEAESGALGAEVERLQGELDVVAEFRRQRIQVHHEHARHAAAEEELTQKYEREITALKFQNLEDRLRLRAVENEMTERFQDEVHEQANKLVDAKGRAIRDENERLRDHTVRLHTEVEELASVADERAEQVQRTQRVAELSLQTQAEYARRGLVQARVAKDAVEKVKQLQVELSVSQREAQALRQSDRAAHERYAADLRAQLDAAHSSLVAHRRDLIRTRNLARRIVAQRSELEQFFYDAIEHVTAEKALDAHQLPPSSSSTQLQLHGANHEGHLQHASRHPAFPAPPPTTRTTLTQEIKVLPEQVRGVVSARRDLGYRGDLDASTVPVAADGVHSGLRAHSARQPSQGCFSAQSDFAVPRSDQVFLTQAEIQHAERQRHLAAAGSSTARSRAMSVPHSSPRATGAQFGVLLEHRQRAQAEAQALALQQQQPKPPPGASLTTAFADTTTAPPPPQQQHASPVESRALSLASRPASQQQQPHGRQFPAPAPIPEMAAVMADVEGSAAADFRALTWSDKEKVICAMLHHLNHATLREQRRAASEAEAERDGDKERGAGGGAAGSIMDLGSGYERVGDAADDDEAETRRRLMTASSRSSLHSAGSGAGAPASYGGTVVDVTGRGRRHHATGARVAGDEDPFPVAPETHARLSTAGSDAPPRPVRNAAGAAAAAAASAGVRAGARLLSSASSSSSSAAPVIATNAQQQAPGTPSQPGEGVSWDGGAQPRIPRPPPAAPHLQALGGRLPPVAVGASGRAVDVAGVSPRPATQAGAATVPPTPMTAAKKPL
jgi:hypothetical protein